MRYVSVVHVVRHGQVHNPDGILYGRLPGFGLSELGQQMAQRLGEYFAKSNVGWLASSPLQRTQETMAPIAAAHPELDVHLDERLIEADNVFAGQKVAGNTRTFFKPTSWAALRNPFRPSWGEPYLQIAIRMRKAIMDAASKAGSGEAILLSHELPIWMARRSAEHKPLIHDPRQRQVGLASVTTFTLNYGAVVKISYREPCADLIPPKKGRGYRPGN